MGAKCFISPPQDLAPEKVCDWLPLEGWMATPEPFREIQLISERAKDSILSLSPMDVSRLPRDLASLFIRRFKSRLTVREMVGESDFSPIIAKVIYDTDRYDLVRIDMPRYRFRMEKAEKAARFTPFLACPYCRTGLAQASGELECRECSRHYSHTGNSYNFLTDDLKREFSVVPTENVAENTIGGPFLRAVLANPEKNFLDVGAGFKTAAYPNLLNMEIADYPSTDILGVGEKLPLLSESMDGVLSECVLEHVKDPFACAREIMRVLKPGGYLYCTAPFLQPVHAYPNHFYNMTRQGLRNLFDGMEIRETLVPTHMHPMLSLAWILKSYLVWLPDQEKHEFARMTVREVLETFPMGGIRPDHPIWKALPKDKLPDIASGNTIIAVKPGALCGLKGAFDE